MKTALLSIIGLIICTSTYSQVRTDSVTGNGQNLIKINLLALPLSSISLQYERVVAKHVSLGLGFRLMPKGNLPFKSTFESLIDEQETADQLNNLKTGNFAITPEVRFYVGKKGALRGFYIAPFARYTNFTAELDRFTFEVNGTEQTIPLSGNLNTITGGILFGSQWKLSKLLYLDWWILGPQYGSSKGKIDGKRTLNAQEQQALRDELEDLDIPLTKSTTTVDANGARLDFKGPWAGVRAGLALGISF